MKNTLFLTLAMASTLLVVSCSGQPITSDDLVLNDSPRVVLKVTGKTPKLEITRESSVDCQKDPKRKGCIDSPRNNQVIAAFKLRDSDGWHFSRFEICAGDEKAPEKCKLELFERLEYAAFTSKKGKLAVPNRRGIIRVGKLGANVKEFFVANQNSVPMDYYYRVEVCRDDDAAEGTEMAMVDLYADDDEGSSDMNEKGCLWNEDPPWQNRGRY
ncbi:MAG: hypothetical protein AB8B57_02430 [Congregibacter sp.]